jgi:hypothetical protein
VEVQAVNCDDANGQNHAVSFNPNIDTPLSQGGVVRNITSDLNGQTLTGLYTITQADADLAGHSQFFVQCATDLASADFHIG